MVSCSISTIHLAFHFFSRVWEENHTPEPFLDPDTFHSLWHLKKIWEILVLFSQILPFPLLLFLAPWGICILPASASSAARFHVSPGWPFPLPPRCHWNQQLSKQLKLLSSSLVELSSKGGRAGSISLLQQLDPAAHFWSCHVSSAIYCLFLPWLVP